MIDNCECENSKKELKRNTSKEIKKEDSES